MSYGTMTLEGRRYVLVPEDEFKAISKGVPALPAVNADGNRPAVAFGIANIAQSLVRDREAVGLTQKELAERAGVRVEILNRAERGAVVPATRTLQKIETALAAAGLKRGGAAESVAAEKKRRRKV